MFPRLEQRDRLDTGQVKTADKNNEMTAILELLSAPDIRGRSISIAAMGCQQDIATQIVDGCADYVRLRNASKGQPAGAVRSRHSVVWSADSGTWARPFFWVAST